MTLLVQICFDFQLNSVPDGYFVKEVVCSVEHRLGVDLFSVFHAMMHICGFKVDFSKWDQTFYQCSMINGGNINYIQVGLQERCCRRGEAPEGVADIPFLLYFFLDVKTVNLVENTYEFWVFPFGQFGAFVPDGFKLLCFIQQIELIQRHI